MHWHIINWNDKKGILGALVYDNAPKSISDFLDMSYGIFDGVLSEEDRAMYMTALLDMAEDDTESELLGRRVRTHVSNNSDKLNMSWVSCDEDPCSFAVYN